MGLDALQHTGIRSWFTERFPLGPSPVQAAAWPAIAAGQNALLSSPTGSGKTLAAFLAILDRLFSEDQAGQLRPGLRCVYVSPLRSLGYDIERNLNQPLREIAGESQANGPAIRVGVRTGDTTANDRRKLRLSSPHILITTPESLALLLSQPGWNEHWRTVEHVLVDEIHALVPTKRGADLTVSLERLESLAGKPPQRIGISATCRPLATVAEFLVGPARSCTIIDGADPAQAKDRLELEVESLIGADEANHRGLTYRRMIRRIHAEIKQHQTTVVFANTRAFTEKITLDLRLAAQKAQETSDEQAEPEGHPTSVVAEHAIAAHHSALDAARRREVEHKLKTGQLKAVVSSTSLELGIDIGSVDLSILIGLPGSVSRCLQRVGRSGHRRGATRRGLLLASTPAELAGAAITAEAALDHDIEPVKPLRNPLDVLCQQLLGMACAGECEVRETLALVRRSSTFASLSDADFQACLAYLSAELAAPAGAYESEQTGDLKRSGARIWKTRGFFAVRNRRVMRWLWSNIGTITTEESVRVRANGEDLGTVEAAYAERLQTGDRFLLDGRVLEVKSRLGNILRASAVAGDPGLPRWTSDRQSISPELALRLASFREEAGQRLNSDGASGLCDWLRESYRLKRSAARVIQSLFEAQATLSEIPPAGGLLIEEAPSPQGLLLAFHAPLARSACEALGRAVCARLGRKFGRNLHLTVADLGWSIRFPDLNEFDEGELRALFAPDRLESDVLDGLDRGELVARRFRYVASTALMVLRNPERGRTRVGGNGWISQRLFPLVKAACPDHPLIREAQREALEDVLDTPAARLFLEREPVIQFRRLAAPSPFCATWIDPSTAPESLAFESPGHALERLHQRLHAWTADPAQPTPDAGEDQ